MKKARILAGLWMGLACAQVQAANEWWCVCDGNWFIVGNGRLAIMRNGGFCTVAEHGSAA